MSPNSERLKDYLGRIVQAIDRPALHVVDIVTQEEFEQDLKASNAVVRCMEIIGEATTKIAKVAPAFVANNLDVPWEAMSTMRNKLIHDYFEVDYGVIWQRVQIMKLISKLSV